MIKPSHLILAGLLSLVCITGKAQNKGYTNPIIPGMHPDPSICRVGEDYYIVNSSFQYFPGVPIHHSKDLVNWELIGNVLDRESQLPLKNTNSWLGIYAPTIRYNDGTFYMVTTNVGSNGKYHGNFYVTATDPAGPWSEPIWLKQEGIDPSFYFEDGKCYLVSNPSGHITLCTIDPKNGEITSEPKVIWDGDGGRYPEAPHIYKHGKWYYLLISEGGTEMGHHAIIARSKNIYGPYKSNPDNPIMTHFCELAQDSQIQGVGHADFVEAHDGSWWTVCLAFRRQSGDHHLLGRETFLAPIEWIDGWPVVNKDGTISLSMDINTLPQKAIAKLPNTEDFTQTDKLGPQWIYLRNYHPENYKLSDKGLELTATPEGLDSPLSPTFVARRLQKIDFTLVVSLCADSDNIETGLSLYMDMHAHYEIFLEVKGEKKFLVSRYRLGTFCAEQGRIEVPNCLDNDIVLRVIGSENNYSFYASYDGGAKFKDLGVMQTRWLSTESAGGFTGVVLGLYAQGEGKATIKSFSIK